MSLMMSACKQDKCQKSWCNWSFTYPLQLHKFLYTGFLLFSETSYHILEPFSYEFETLFYAETDPVND